MPLTLFEDPAPPPLIVEPVALMRLVEIDEISELEDTMRRMRLGPADFTAETKFNGWLMQVAGGRLYSRRGEDLTGKFPEIAGVMSRYTSEHLIGELVYWGADGRMELPVVTSIAMTKSDREAAAKLKALPGTFNLILFDALAVRGNDITRRPTFDRVEILRDAVTAEGPVVFSEPSRFEDWERVYEAGVAVGGDGVVLKNIHSPYIWRLLGQPEPRPVGAWYKLKPTYTDDFVVFDQLRGPKGKLLVRIGQYHEGQLVEVGTIDNFSKGVEAEVLERLARGPFVMEIEHQGRFPDPPGALQHGRFFDFRDDKDLRSVELPERYAPRAEGGSMGANEGTMLSEWERCGNTLFYVKTRPHERVGYTYISPSEFSIVKWEEMPEGYVVARMEAPDQADWAVKELLDFRLTSLPPDLFQGFKNWNIVFQHALNDGLSPAEITDLFHHGYSQKQKMTILDALDRGFFAAEIPWRVQTRVVQKQELDETLSDFGVMECI